eukprot:CAMPEP_0178934138 /NCGR_PEP_ID=MMETSP0786-20121207/23701_1 /TAXON_ID=186022 /ORGANISM="Thalassionema frauenfeldii, Strain CCMP 1798" /LENGTH=513 /DNA_ID=CAMNT_0020611897 /DNA_START=212 /DNA_END=1753 /DNA_ORIENTATION=+
MVKPCKARAHVERDVKAFWPSATEDDAKPDGEDDYDLRNVLDSILKIHCTHSEPDFLIPWQRQHQSTSTSSGFVIEIGTEGGEKKRRVMTNAHSVDYGSIIQVQRRGQSEKYQARIEAQANECDLALLEVEDESFWEGLEPLNFGDLPMLQDEVEVLGYPTGGDSLSVTKGVVSRIELQEYTQATSFLLAMQIDAAINSGNSGGPVVNEDRKIVGVAFQGLEGAENIGYVVPVTVVQHFLEDIQRHGRYTGFCTFGISYYMLENASFRRSLGMKDGMSGVRIGSVDPTAASLNILQKNDVILEIDGISLGNDGKVPYRPGERVAMNCYLHTKFDGDFVSVKLLRDGEIFENVRVPVSIQRRLVPAHFQNQPPPYVVVAGLVFTVLSIPYLYAYDAWADYVSDKICYLLNHVDKPLEKSTDQMIVLTQVLAHPKNLGYDKLQDLHLKKINGKDVKSLQHFRQLLSDCQDEYIRLELAPDDYCIVLERASMDQITKEVCEEHFISKDYVTRIPQL